MSSVGYATLQVIPSLKGLDREISGQLGGVSSAGKQAGQSFSGGFKSALPLLAAAIGAVGFGALAGEAIAASDATDKFKQTLNFAGLNTSAIDALTASTRKYADQTVYDLSDIQNITAQLAANSVPNYDKLAQAAGNLNAVAGGNKETFKSVGMMLTQTAGAGKLTTENWNQLADAIPGASGLLQAAMLKNGAYTGNFRTAMEKGQITAEEFNAAIMELGMTDAAQKAATSTATFEGAWGSLKATMVGGLADIFTKFKPAITSGMGLLANGIQAAMPGILAGIDGISSAISGLVTAAKPTIDTFMSALQGGDSGFQTPWLDAVQAAGWAVVGVLGQVSPAIDTFSGMLAEMAPSAALLGSAFLTTLVPALAGLSTASLPIIAQFNTLRMTLIEGLVPILVGLATVVATVIVPALAALAAGFVANVLPAVSQVITAFQNAALVVIPIVSQIVTFVLAKFAEWGPTIALYMGQVTQIIGGVLTIIAAIITTAVNGFQIIWATWGGTILAVVGAIFDTIVGVIGGALNIIQGIIKTVTSIMSGDWKGAMDGLGQAAQGGVDMIKSVFGGLVNIAGTLLSGAGAATMNGFLGGLKSAWGAVTDFVGGIAPWIASHKGPISYDYKLLQPAGKATMGGLVDSMAGQMPALESMVGRVTDTLSGAGGSAAYELAGRPASGVAAASAAGAGGSAADLRAALSGLTLRIDSISTVGDYAVARIYDAVQGV